MVQLVDEFTSHWIASGLDALVCPALALPALTHGASADLTPACSYTLGTGREWL